ncbi:2-oxoadipate dioxygenase/decarboxylase family protein [Leisingera sp.]|uniref:2-oxoadipate dioxygenase/decarboxylase family protein n=1 Tax=Leisingera sp. TaxID=1879318 RepID=UPI003A8E3C4B
MAITSETRTDLNRFWSTFMESAEIGAGKGGEVYCLAWNSADRQVRDLFCRWCEGNAVLAEEFAAFPDEWATIRAQGLGYFHYFPTCLDGKPVSIRSLKDITTKGLIGFAPITYEVFLLVSAAGITQSDLSNEDVATSEAVSNKSLFEQELVASIFSPVPYHAGREQQSIEAALAHFGPGSVE